MIGLRCGVANRRHSPAPPKPLTQLEKAYGQGLKTTQGLSNVDQSRQAKQRRREFSKFTSHLSEIRFLA